MFIISTAISCNTKTNTNEGITSSSGSAQDVSVFTGNYVDESYAKREEGYDWVSVSVHQITDSAIHVSVRSRIDKKKPTCTFDADAVKTADNQFQSNIDGKVIVYTFNKDTINIKTYKDEEKDFLQYYCSGGGNFAGSYTKINAPLDEKQVDPRVFIKMLSLQNIIFDVSTIGNGSVQQLIIQPFGLKTDNKKINLEIDGKVTNAEIEDLNADGYPELLIYTTSAGSGSYGNVIGYSVNAGKSMSQIYFPSITDNPEAKKGYMGHDEFTIVETSLVRRFPIYKDDDSNSKPTGGIRQIQYKLKEGEASRQFVVDKIVEY